MTIVPHHSIEELFQMARRERRSPVSSRIRLVAMAQQGHSSATIAGLTGESSRTVERWVRRYNQAGIESLDDRPRSGRPPKLGQDQQAAFMARIDDGPIASDGVSTLHGRDYQRILEEEFGVLYSLDGVYKLLHRFGYSWLMPRPRHEKADPQALEDFKKTSMPSYN